MPSGQRKGFAVGKGRLKLSPGQGKKIKKKSLTRPLRKKDKGKKGKEQEQDGGNDRSGVQWRSPEEQADWFTRQFHASYGSLLSALEQDAVTGENFAQLEEGKDHSVDNLSSHLKTLIGTSWQETLCGAKLAGEGSEREAGSISVLVICSSANRCVEILRGMKSFFKDCKPAKLFSRHIQLEEQVEALKRRVNIVAGTPNRIRKLVDIGALGLGNLSLVLLDMHQDAKGLTVFSVPEVKREFWELYRSHLRSRLPCQQFRFCLY